MITINDKQFRNLEEQVLKNQEDIKYLLEEGGTLNQFGIKVIGQVDNASELPDSTTYEGEYGDAFAVGTEPPYDLYIFTRAFSGQLNPFWFNIGQFPVESTVPGPIGPEGPVGKTGASTKWYYGYGINFPTAANDGDFYLDTSKGDIYTYLEFRTQWVYIGNIRGPQGIQGVGIQGPKGDPGQDSAVPGPQGPKGEFVHIVGQLTNINQLPDPSTIEDKTSAYLVVQTNGTNLVYVIIGDGTEENPYTWINAGNFGQGSIIRANGQIIPEANLDYYVNQNQINYTGRDTVKRNAALPNGLDDNYVDFNIGSTPTIGSATDMKNLAGNQVTLLRTVRLGIVDSDTIVRKAKDTTGLGSYHLQLDLSDEMKTKLNNAVVSDKTPKVVFGTDTIGELTKYDIDIDVLGNNIPIRKGDGNISLPLAPNADTDAVCKKYVDDTEDTLRGEIQVIEDNYAPKNTPTFEGTVIAPGLILGNLLLQNSNPTRMLTVAADNKTVTWSNLQSLYRYDVTIYGRLDDGSYITANTSISLPYDLPASELSSNITELHTLLVSALLRGLTGISLNGLIRDVNDNQILNTYTIYPGQGTNGDLIYYNGNNNDIGSLPVASKRTQPSTNVAIYKYKVL